MTTKVIMPKAGMAMEEGVIVAWLKKPGDAVRRGEPIVEIETDKTTMEIEAEESGVLLSILRDAGDRVAVTETIAWIGAPGDVPPESGAPAGGAGAQDVRAPVAPGLAPSRSGVPATPAARRLAAEAGIGLTAIAAPGGGAIHADDVRRHVRKDATPLASRLAEAAGLDPGTLPRPEGGRVRKADVVAAMASDRAAGWAAESDRGAREAGEPAIGDRRVPLTSVQRISGERIARSHAEIPAVTVFAVADATDLLAMRRSINEAGNPGASVNDLALMACAKALAANPRANAFLDGDALVLKGRINLGIAVATREGLVVPTLPDADRLPLSELSRRSKDLADRARQRRLRPGELEGATFTVTNIGMYGITFFTPVIVQPQVGILGVGTIEDRLGLDPRGTPVVRKLLHLSFTFDHRALDGAEASAFVTSVRDLIERPLAILV